jgi:hypothetical protein
MSKTSKALSPVLTAYERAKQLIEAEKAKKQIRKAQGGMVDSAPEEAIKNTITDPQAFRMLDMDLANLALMNQPQRMAGGGVVHMSKAGSATDAAVAFEKAKKAAEKAAKANPAPLPRAPIKTDKEIMAIAQRMAPQVRGDFVRNPSGTQGVMGLSRKQWEREQGLVHDIRDTRPLEEPPVVDYKDLRGEVKVGIKGDPTLTDKTIYAVDNNVLREPSPQEGGSMYGVNSPAAWASGPIPATTVSNLSRNASRQYGNVPSFAEYVKMGPDSHAYAVHVSDALLQAMHPERMTKKQLNGFNQLIKNGDPNYGRFPNWAGIENPEEAFLQLAAHPDLRQVFYNTATMPTITNAFGMPNGLDVVHATLDPKLRNLETGATGRALVRIDPNVSSLPLSRHTTYERDIPGHSFGQTKFPMPYELSFPDTLKSIKENPVQAPREFGSFGMVGPRQIIDDQFIDEINRYNQMMDDLLKKKKGGAVHMEDGGDVELPTGGLSQEVGTNPLSIYNQKLPKPEMRLHPRRKTAPSGEPSTMDVARELGMLAKEQAGEEWDTLKANPVRGALDILNRGMVAGNVGAPVDIVNMGLQGVNYLTKKAGLGGDWASDKPVMGSKWIEDKMDKLGFTSDKKYPMLELAANFLNPVGITSGAAKAAPVVGKNVLMPLAEKGLTMYEKGQLTPGLKPTSEMFMGSKSQGADLAARDVAKARLAAGEDPALVWKETGWAAPPWAPNDLRYEISDAPMTTSASAAVGAKLSKHDKKMQDLLFNDPYGKSPQLLRESRKSVGTIGKLSGTVGDYIDHPEFFAGYPDFAKDIKFKTLGARDAKNFYGMFNAYNKDLSANAALLHTKPERARETLLHELQHAVQAREGFNPGGTSKGVVDYPHAFDPATAQARQTLFDTAMADTGRLGDLYRKKQTSVLPFMENQELIHRIKGMPEHTAYEQAKKDFFAKGTPDELYKRLAGEAEARLTQSRKNLTQEERLDRYPYDPERFKNATGYDLNDIIANPARGTFRNGGAARHPSIEEMRIEMMERKHG